MLDSVVYGHDHSNVRNLRSDQISREELLSPPTGNCMLGYYAIQYIQIIVHHERALKMNACDVNLMTIAICIFRF